MRKMKVALWEAAFFFCAVNDGGDAAVKRMKRRASPQRWNAVLGAELTYPGDPTAPRQR